MMPMDPTGWSLVFWISMLIGLVFTLALLVLAVLAIVWLVRLLSRESGGSRPVRPPDTDPMRALDSRYARGEIDRDTYLRVREDLEQRRGAG